MRRQHLKANILLPTQSAEDWKQFLAEPDKQWKTGFSAKALAYCWQEANGFPESVKSVFSSTGVFFSSLEPLIIIPEHKVALPDGKRPSQNDIWILAKSYEELVSITVEGKVSEPFGKTITEWLKDNSKGKRERLDYLIKELNLKDGIPGSIRYQLVHRTVSAIIEAKRFNTSHAMMIVHSFSQSHKWFDDYKDFLSLFNLDASLNRVSSVSNIDDVCLHFAWITGEEKYLYI